MVGKSNAKRAPKFGNSRRYGKDLLMVGSKCWLKSSGGQPPTLCVVREALIGGSDLACPGAVYIGVAFEQHNAPDSQCDGAGFCLEVGCYAFPSELRLA